MTVAEAVETLEGLEFRFAKTMPRNPHWYVVRDRHLPYREFNACTEAIRSAGRKIWWEGRPYVHLLANGFSYWTMGAPVEDTVVINRKRARYDAAYDEVGRLWARRCDSPERAAARDEVRDFVERRIGGNVGARRVLDVGCGHGPLLDWWDPERYTGLDPSVEMLLDLVARHPQRRGDVLNCTFADFHTTRQYDLVVALFGSGDYVDDPDRLASLLAPGGVAVVMTRESPAGRSEAERAMKIAEPRTSAEARDRLPVAHRVGRHEIRVVDGAGA